MKTLLTLTITLLTLTSCSPSLNCSDFKTGMYRYVNIGMPTEIERTATMQTETDPIDKIVVKSVVTWTSECEYILTYSEILNHPKDVNDVMMLSERKSIVRLYPPMARS